MRTAASLVLLLALSISLIASPSQSPPSAAALAKLRAAAERGDPQAQLAYAKVLPREEGRAWAHKAADQGLADAWYWLAQTMTGDTIPFYERAAALGHADAFSYLLDGLLFRAADKADVVKAKKFGDLARASNVPLGSSRNEMLATIDRCYDAGAPTIPPGDLPGKTEAAALATADCVAMREGIGQPVDLAQYGKCMLAQEPYDNNQIAELYANGWGVRRNPRLAIALVCHASTVPAELFGMVKTLDTTRSEAQLDEPFTFCDHVTSGQNQGQCAADAEAIAESRREAAFATVTAKWPEAHKTLLRALQQAGGNFFTTRSSAELDMSGTARIAIAIDEEASLRTALLDAIKAFEVGMLPPNASFARADADLNAMYARIMKRQDLDMGTVTKDGIRETQRAWLPYRDAWAAFGAARYPTVTADTWKAWATAARVAQLKEFLP